MYKLTIQTNSANSTSFAMELHMLQLNQWKPDCKSWAETQSNHFLSVTRCITHAESTCTSHYCNTSPLGSGGSRFSLQPQAKDTPALFFHYTKYKMPQPDHMKLRLKLRVKYLYVHLVFLPTAMN